MDDRHAWSRGLRSVLLGRDPFEIEALHRDLYQATIYHGGAGSGSTRCRPSTSRSTTSSASSWDAPRTSSSAAPAATRSGPTRRSTPAFPAAARSASSWTSIARGFERALELGFRAIKMEAFFGDLVSDRELVGCIEEGRRLVGDDTTLLVDFGYRWSDWRAALWTLNRLEDCDLYLAEATLQHDDLDGHAKLAARAETRIGGAEMAATRFECREWIEHGRRRRPPARRQPRRRTDRDGADRPARGAGRRARRAARLEDGDHRRRRASLPGRDAERPVRRAPLPRPLRLAAAARARLARADDRRRRDRAADRSRSRDRARRGAVERYRA